MLAVENPALLLTIILLGSHLIVSNKDKLLLNIISLRLFQLFIYISNHVLHQTLPIFFYHGQKYILSVIHNIGVLMPVIIQCLLVLFEFEAFLPRNQHAVWRFTPFLPAFKPMQGNNLSSMYFLKLQGISSSINSHWYFSAAAGIEFVLINSASLVGSMDHLFEQRKDRSFAQIAGSSSSEKTLTWDPRQDDGSSRFNTHFLAHWQTSLPPHFAAKPLASAAHSDASVLPCPFCMTILRWL